MSRHKPPQTDPTANPTSDPAALPAPPPQAQPAIKDGRPAATVKSRPTIDAVTGSLSLSIPLDISPGRDNFRPTLSLSYDSSTGNGAFGLGWRLGVESISRKTSRHIPRYDGNDVFTLSGADDLVPGAETTVGPWRVRRYQPRVEGAVERIERWASAADQADVHWRTISAENVTTLFGRTPDSRIADEGGRRVFEWLACESYDAKGNRMVFTYKREDAAGVAVTDACELSRSRGAARYLKSIKYGNRLPNRDLSTWEVVDNSGAAGNGWLFEVLFDYGEHDEAAPTTAEVSGWAARKEAISRYTSGFEVRTYRLCRRVLMFHHIPEHLGGAADTLVSSTAFSYDESTPSGSALLTSCTRSGHSGTATQSLPPIEFTYSAAPALSTLLPTAADTTGLPSLPSSLTSTQFLDLDGEGAPGVLTRRDTAWTYARNLSALTGTPSFGAPRVLPSVPALGNAASFFEDLEGTGRPALITVDEAGGLQGYHLRSEEGGWENFVPFRSVPTVDTMDPRARRIDLTGDGTADLLFFGGGWYQSLGDGGFMEMKGVDGSPEMALGDQQAVIYTADMNGDGLADIVRVANGSVWYWPNMGYGRFGGRVVMGNAPAPDRADQFSHARVRLVDVDGSGTTDLIYLTPNGGARVYYNRAGNRWSEAERLPSFPELDSIAGVEACDLLGQGTGCLCWTSPSAAGGAVAAELRYIDLMGGTRPGLLTGMVNGLGAETEVAYVPSTRFYLEDERSGNPWATRLAFPVMCVERVVARDMAAGTESTVRHKYHEGYYDNVEREFRGFGMVEVWDAEDFAVGVAAGGAFKRPPMHTKSWFHTGAQLPESPAKLLAASALPAWTSAAEHRDACRALKGRPIRQEVYADDGSPHAALPYSIAEQNYEVRRIRAEAGTGVYRVAPREELTCHSERLAGGDARLGHDIVLEVNAYGQTTRSVSINYGRAGGTLPDPRDKARQAETVIVYVEQEYTNAIDDASGFRAPLPAGSARFRVLGAGEAGKRLEFEELVKDAFKFFTEAVEVPVEGAEAGTGKRKVCIARDRLYYASGDQTKRLPQRGLELYSTVDQSFRLALTAGDLEALKAVFPAGGERGRLLEAEGGYKELDGDGVWWTPSMRTLFGRTAGADELQEARRGFYIPAVEVDQWGGETATKLDAFQLLRIETTDSVGNTTRFSNDYSALQVTLTTDENGNRTQAAVDCFGRVVGVAVMGKAGQTGVGDSLDGFAAVLTEAQVEAFMLDPESTARALLHTAGIRKIYGTSRYHRTRGKAGAEVLPAFEAVITRDVHASEGAQIGIHITYLDGSGSGAIQETSLHAAGAWRFSGWVISDNKSQPVREFLPFFAGSHSYTPQTAPAPPDAAANTLLRDPANRAVGKLYADHSWSKVRRSAWATETFDAGDTVLVADPGQDEDVGGCFRAMDPAAYLPTWHARMAASADKWERDAAEKAAAAYSGTPLVVHLDTLGRTIAAITDNGTQGKYTSRYEFDVLGNQVGVWDALDRRVTKSKFDLAGRVIYDASMDGGERWALSNCFGQSLLAWNARGMRRRTTYDGLGRVTGQWLVETAGGAEVMVGKMVYGEGVAQDVAENLRGQLYQCFDQAGAATNASFDFKGNCVRSEVAAAEDYKSTLDWSAATPPALEAPASTAAEFDALNREWKSTAADKSITKRTFSVGGSLQTVSFAHVSAPTVWAPYITSITYAADQLRTAVSYGNTSRTENTYDPRTRALKNTKTTRSSDGKVLLNLAYSYDCLGRVTHTVDAAQQDVYFRNNKVAPELDYRYDAVGQLAIAQGREQVDVADGGGRGLRPYSAAGGPEAGVPGDANAMCRYTETYTYDAAGNIVSLAHAATDDAALGRWTRRYYYEEPSCIDPAAAAGNRLSRTMAGGVTEAYGYDGDAGKHGCMTAMPGYSLLRWDFNDRLRSSAQQQVRDGGTPETTYYVYNAAGTRTRKVTERSTGKKLKETHYLAGCDTYTTYAGDGATPTLARTTSRVIDGTPEAAATLALLEYTPATALLLPRYQTSENLELDGAAQVITYTEYSPFGAPTYTARRSEIEAPRQYRFARYEHDAETGLYHCGERYYAAWLGRWTSPDPIGIGDGLNVYRYVRNDPVNLDDAAGTSGRGRGTPDMNKALGGRAPAAPTPATPPRPVISYSQAAGSRTPATGVAGPTAAAASPSPAPAASSSASSAPASTSTAASAVSNSGAAATKPAISYAGAASKSAAASSAPSTSAASSAAAAPAAPESYTTLYRSTDFNRGGEFLDTHNPDFVTTQYTGDFNHIPGTAAYFTNDLRSALQRAGKKNMVVAIEVPNSVLNGPSSFHYPEVPNAAWEKRVNSDRLGRTFASADDVQNKDVSVGPESNQSTTVYQNSRGPRKIHAMNPLYREGSHVQQYVFKGKALEAMRNWRKFEVNTRGPTRPYTNSQEQSPLSWFHPDHPLYRA